MMGKLTKATPPASRGTRFTLDAPGPVERGPHCVRRRMVAAGWLIPPPGGVLESLDFQVGDEVLARAETGLARPDVGGAFPKVEGSGRSGFRVELALDRWAGRTVELDLTARWADGPESLGRMQVEVEAGGEDAAVDDPNRAVSEFWDKQFEVMRTARSYWLNNKIVEGNVRRQMTGGDQHWLPWLFETYFQNRKFRRALSICCGDGATEATLLRAGWVDKLVGFDLSEGALRQAADRLEGEGIARERYDLSVGDANNLSIAGRFDLILGCGAIHHVEKLEDLLSKSAAMLDPDGYFVMVEYVGPNRFQWSDERLALMNGVLDALDPAYRAGDGQGRCEAPDLATLIAADPSEAVRSGDILGVLDVHFEVELRRDFNGNILHWLHPLLNPDLVNEGRADFDSIVRLIAFFEGVLVKGGHERSDFTLIVCRPKRPAP